MKYLCNVTDDIQNTLAVLYLQNLYQATQNMTDQVLSPMPIMKCSQLL